MDSMEQLMNPHRLLHGERGRRYELARQRMHRRQMEAALQDYDALLLWRTAQHAPRTMERALPAPAPAGRWWHCRVCQVDCGGQDGFRRHCMSDEHYDGLQLFGLHPDLFTDRLHLLP